MCESCESAFARSLLCVVNMIFFFLGTVMLGIGIWLAIDKTSLVALFKLTSDENLGHFTQPNVIEHMGYAMIAFGALIFLVSCLGYFGSIKNSTCLLSTYASILMIIIIAEVSLGIVAAVYKDQARAETKTYLQKTIANYYATGEKETAVNVMWDKLMVEMHCCGVNNYTDFTQLQHWNQTKGDRVVPDACCMRTATGELADPDCPQRPGTASSYFDKGCYDVLNNYVISHRNIILITCVTFGVIELVLICLSCCLGAIVGRAEF